MNWRDPTGNLFSAHVELRRQFSRMTRPIGRFPSVSTRNHAAAFLAVRKTEAISGPVPRKQ